MNPRRKSGGYRSRIGGRRATRVVESLESRDLLTLVILPFAPVAGVTDTDQPIAAFNLGDVNGTTATDFKATIDWGDSDVGVTGQVVQEGAGFVVEGTHTYQSATPPGSPETIGVVVANAGGLAGALTPSVASAVGVADVSPAPIALTDLDFTAEPGSPFEGKVASFTDPDPSVGAGNFLALIDWGDGISSTGAVSGNAASGFSVQGIHTYATAGAFMTTVTVDPVVGSPGVIEAGPSVNGVASVSLPQPFTPLSQYIVTQAGTALPPGTVAGSFEYDPTFAAGSPGTPFTATINWGDGHILQGVVVPATAQPNPASPGNPVVYDVEGTNTYASAGTYLVTVTVADRFGFLVTIASTVVVTGSMANATGGLDLGGENGLAAAAGFADTDRPTFSGTTTPFALVQLHARAAGIDATLPLGQTVAGLDGTWSLGVGPLSDGIFAISAVVTPAGGSPTAPLPLVNAMPGGATGLYVIDTAAPNFVGVQSDGKGHVLVRFQDGLSGTSASSLEQTANYIFINANGSTDHPTSVVVLPDSGRPTDIATVQLTPGGNPKSAPKALQITAAGILDNAGNTLAANARSGIAPARNPIVKVPHPKAKPARR